MIVTKAAPALENSDRILRAWRATKLAHRAMQRGNYERTRRLAHYARALLHLSPNAESDGEFAQGEKWQQS